MMARIYLGALPNEIVKENDYIITTDSDLIPVSNSYFNFYNTKAITVLNAYCIGFVDRKRKKYEMFPMAYIGMRKWQWKEVMNMSGKEELNGETMMTHLRLIHGDGMFRKNVEVMRGDEIWYLDQKTVTIVINEYVNDENFKFKRKLNKFRFTGFRLDRSDTPSRWYGKIDSFNLVIDAHMYHADSKVKVKLIVDFLKRLFNKNICDMLNTYFREFFSLI
jgi:hypothetical protein